MPLDELWGKNKADLQAQLMLLKLEARNAAAAAAEVLMGSQARSKIKLFKGPRKDDGVGPEVDPERDHRTVFSFQREAVEALIQELRLKVVLTERGARSFIIALLYYLRYCTCFDVVIMLSLLLLNFLNLWPLIFWWAKMIQAQYFYGPML